jgi:hypothetical protein
VINVQVLTIVVVGAPREMNLGRQAQIGTDGVLIRFIWSSVGGNEIPWDEIGIWPRFSKSPRQILIDFPVLFVIIPLVSVVIGFRKKLRHAIPRVDHFAAI